ncbi:MoxR family ATPase [Desulfoscipio sp. XC116]|uniref:AAA family ATPase n=1 Tax=Desulfoscipio sp. XC116 TaxID=3144975 RepID=UPI00325AB8F4
MKNTELLKAVANEVKKVIIGKDSIVDLVLTAILAGGHILIEDIPGVGKTTLALAFSKAMSLEGKRMQFTPDVLPTDVTGFSVYNKAGGEFEYKPGVAMCNLFLADEINRTSPKTQSALLEVMEEGKITVDGVTHEVPKPFIVIATQNPLGAAGTQPLPESQLDRFMIRLTMGYPADKDEVNMLCKQRESGGIADLKSVIDGQMLKELQAAAEKVFLDYKIMAYIVKLVNLTRRHPLVRLGLSPRATLALASVARACAFAQGRDYVIPEDVQFVFEPVANHRLLLEPRAKIDERTVSDVLQEILRQAGAVELASSRVAAK